MRINIQKNNNYFPAIRRYFFYLSITTFLLFAPYVSGQSEVAGEGIDSQLLWPSAGPSNFLTLLSSDLTPARELTFSILSGYARKPLGYKFEDNSTKWAVKNCVTMDFMLALGIADIFQVGLAMPLVLAQSGVGATPLKPEGEKNAGWTLAGSVLRDIRTNIKVKFWTSNENNPDMRGLGLALDLGIAFPTGDELNFQGEKNIVFFPTIVFDYHKYMVSLTANAGVRLRVKKAKFIDLEAGHQSYFAIGITHHLAHKRLPVGVEAVHIMELGDTSRMVLEIRSFAGFIIDQARTTSIWLSGGTSIQKNTLMGAPALRILVGLKYSP